MTIDAVPRQAKDYWRSLTDLFKAAKRTGLLKSTRNRVQLASTRWRATEPRAALETATARLRTAAADLIDADPRAETNPAVTLWRTISTTLMDAEPRAVLFVSSEGNEGEIEAALLACREACREGFEVCLIVADDGRTPTSKAEDIQSNEASGLVISLLGHSLRIEKGAAGQPDILRLKLEGELLRDIVSRSQNLPTNGDDDLRRQLLARLNRKYKFIIIVGGSVLVNPYSLIFADRVPGVVLVVRSGHARLHDVGRAVSLVEASGGSILGSVLTDQPSFLPDWIERRL